MDVGERLGLDPLGRVDDEDRAFAGLQAVADLVGEVDMAGRVDEIQAVHQPVVGRVLEARRARLDRDPLLALEVHRVQDLARHLPGVDGVGHLEQAIGQGRLAVVDVGDDAEVAQALLGDHGSSGQGSTAKAVGRSRSVASGPSWPAWRGPRRDRPTGEPATICRRARTSRRAREAPTATAPRTDDHGPHDRGERWQRSPEAGPALGRRPPSSGSGPRNAAPR